MENQAQQEPLISFGVLVFGALVIAAGLLWTVSNYDAGMLGWTAFWPAVAAGVVALLANAIAMISPGGSIVVLLREMRE